MKIVLIRGKKPIYKYIFYRNKDIKKTSFLTIQTILTLSKFMLFLITWKKFRIMYTGKGYRIRKHTGLNLLDFTFGACHFVKAFLPKYKLKLRKKRSITVFYKNSANLMAGFWKITNIKLINLYTQRGLRNSKKITFRKPKSKAAYI